MKSSALICGLAAGWLAGCSGEMAEQPRYEPMERSPLFADGAAARPPPAGTRSWRPDEAAEPARPALDLPLLQRGQARYLAFCAVCHGPDGYGSGIVVRRGFPPPPSFHSDRLRAADDAHLFHVITEGYGVMYPYGARVSPRDRWAIIAYIRALQQSQHARVSELPPELRERLPSGEEGAQ